MLKGSAKLLLAVLFTVIGISQVLGTPCLSTTSTWGGDDPHVFYYCNPTTNETGETACPEGKGYVDNGETAGCVDWADWTGDCIGKEPISAATCQGSEALHLHGYGDPSYFYLCTEPDSVPQKLSCKSGYGFYSGNKYMGCFPWAQWRQYSGCVNEEQ